MPTNAAPSNPTASLRRGIGSRAKWSARSTAEPPHSGPTSQPSIHIRNTHASRSPRTFSLGTSTSVSQIVAAANSSPNTAPTTIHAALPPVIEFLMTASFIRIRTPATTVPSGAWSSPPTSRTNVSSRLASPRTSSSGPAATTCPRAMIATVSQSCSTSAITWLDSTTEPPPATNPLQDRLERRRRHRVDRLERLVEHQQPRRVQQRRGQADLLAHAGGVVDHQRAARRRSEFQTSSSSCARPAATAGVEAAQLADVRQQLPRRSAARASPARRAAPRSAPSPRRDRSTRRRRTPATSPASGRSSPTAIDNSGRLARAVRADQPEEGAPRHHEVDVVHRHIRAELLVQPGQPQRCRPALHIITFDSAGLSGR